MKATLISLHPQWVKKIMSGEKIYEVRKRAPLCKVPFKVYIYCTKNGEEQFFNGNEGKSAGYKLNGTVCGEFTCTRIFKVLPPYKDKTNGTCLSARNLYEYDSGYGRLQYMEIKNPILYDTPRTLSDFGIKLPPVSWMYCEELQDG